MWLMYALITIVFWGAAFYFYQMSKRFRFFRRRRTHRPRQVMNKKMIKRQIGIQETKVEALTYELTFLPEPYVMKQKSADEYTLTYGEEIITILLLEKNRIRVEQNGDYTTVHLHDLVDYISHRKISGKDKKAKQ